MADWRDTMIAQLISIGQGEGIATFDRAKVEELFKKLAEIDRPKKSTERVGYAYVLDSYKPAALEGLMTKIAALWTPEQKQIPQAPAASGPAPAIKQMPSSTHEMRCVIALKLAPGKSVTKEALDTLIKSKLPEQLGNCTFENFQMVHDSWCDVLVSYTIHLAKIYEVLLEADGVEDAVTKPAADFGRRTIATAR